MDFLSAWLVILNLVVTGNLAIFWRAPRLVTQCFLILISVLIALLFLEMPDWTVWGLLALLVVYDACVVLLPHGLLSVLIRKAEERGDMIPALMYSSVVFGVDGSDSSDPGTTCKRRRVIKPDTAVPQDLLEEVGELGQRPERRVQLGLGDFCFYEILVTRAARLGWDLVILCVLAVVLGLSLTLLVLVWARRPLPALPFSLVLGVTFFVIGVWTFRPYQALLGISGLAF